MIKSSSDESKIAIRYKASTVFSSFRLNVLKGISSSYVQSVTENIILTSQWDMSYVVRNQDRYVSSIQMVSHNKLKHQVGG